MSNTEIKSRPFNEDELITQIGMGNLFAISGGRVIVEPYVEPTTGLRQGAIAVELPVAKGYRVRIELDFMDTWTVKRVLMRKGEAIIKGIQEDVYADEVSEVAYRASLFVSEPDWGKK